MTFKIGDRVRLIRNTSGSANKVGDIGVVIGLEGPYADVMVNGMHTDSGWSFLTDLKIVNDSKQQDSKHTAHQYIGALVSVVLAEKNYTVARQLIDILEEIE